MGSGTDATKVRAANEMTAAVPSSIGTRYHQLAWLAASTVSSKLANWGSRKEKAPGRAAIDTTVRGRMRSRRASGAGSTPVACCTASRRASSTSLLLRQAARGGGGRGSGWGEGTGGAAGGGGAG